MTKTAVREQITHRWYTRPVLFVADVNRALRFYIDMLGFEKSWHEGDGAGKVCQVNRGGMRDHTLRACHAKRQGALVRGTDIRWAHRASP